MSSGGWRSKTAWAFSWHYRLTFRRAIASGVLIVAAAGNENQDLDGADSLYVPCEVPDVLCVGAMNNGTTTRAFYGTTTTGKLIGSNFGSPIDVFAPHPRIANVANVNPGSISNVEVTFPGTSGAAPYVAGVAALVWSVNLQQSGADVQNTIVDTRHFHAIDKNVQREGVVHAYGAVVQSAGHNVPPTIRVSPGTGTVINDIRTPPTFVATVADVDGDPLTVRWIVDGEDTGFTGTTFRPDRGVFPHPGTYSLVAFVTDGVNVRFDSVLVTVANVPISASIVDPLFGQIVHQGSPITLRGTADDDYGVASLVWTSSSEPSGTLLSGALGTFAFTQLGAQTLTLTATDVFGASTSVSTTINVMSTIGTAPTVSLLQPVASSVVFVPVNDTVFYQLSATATDAEDGVLGDPAFSWYVDGVFLGHGAQRQAAIQGPVCNFETHVARVEVVDSDGLQSIAEVVFFANGSCGG